MNIFFESIETFWDAIIIERDRIKEDITPIYVINGQDIGAKKIPSFALCANFQNVILCYSQYYNGYWQVGAEKIIQERLVYLESINCKHYQFIRSYSVPNKDKILQGYLAELMQDKETRRGNEKNKALVGSFE